MFIFTDGHKPPVTLRQVDIPYNCSSTELLQAIRSELSLAEDNIVLKVNFQCFTLIMSFSAVVQVLIGIVVEDILAAGNIILNFSYLC